MNSVLPKSGVSGSAESSGKLDYSVEQFVAAMLVQIARRKEWQRGGVDDYFVDFSMATPVFLCGCPAQRSRVGYGAEPQPTDPHYRLTASDLSVRHRDYKNCRGGVIATINREQLPEGLRNSLP